jgi:hypothetical protein
VRGGPHRGSGITMGWLHDARVSKAAIHSRPYRSPSTGFCGVLAVFVLSGAAPLPINAIVTMADATREAWMRLGKPLRSVPNILSNMSRLLGHSADVRRGACVLLYLQRADYARCRERCEPQPLRGSDAIVGAGLASAGGMAIS